MNEQLLTSMAAVVGLVALILLATLGFDRRLSLVEYGWKVQRCPACGRSCFGRRYRATRKDPWGAWQSECCEQPLSEPVD